MDPSRRQFLPPHEPQNLAPPRRGNRGEDPRSDLHVINLDKTKMKSKRIIVVLAASTTAPADLESIVSSAVLAVWWRRDLCEAARLQWKRIASRSDAWARRPPARNAASRRPTDRRSLRVLSPEVTERTPRKMFSIMPSSSFFGSIRAMCEPIRCIPGAALKGYPPRLSQRRIKSEYGSLTRRAHSELHRQFSEPLGGDAQRRGPGRVVVRSRGAGAFAAQKGWLDRGSRAGHQAPDRGAGTRNQARPFRSAAATMGERHHQQPCGDAAASEAETSLLRCVAGGRGQRSAISHQGSALGHQLRAVSCRLVSVAVSRCQLSPARWERRWSVGAPPRPTATRRHPEVRLRRSCRGRSPQTQDIRIPERGDLERSCRASPHRTTRAARCACVHRRDSTATRARQTSARTPTRRSRAGCAAHGHDRAP